MASNSTIRTVVSLLVLHAGRKLLAGLLLAFVTFGVTWFGY